MTEQLRKLRRQAKEYAKKEETIEVTVFDEADKVSFKIRAIPANKVTKSLIAFKKLLTGEGNPEDELFNNIEEMAGPLLPICVIDPPLKKGASTEEAFGLDDLPPKAITVLIMKIFEMTGFIGGETEEEAESFPERTVSDVDRDNSEVLRGTAEPASHAGAWS